MEGAAHIKPDADRAASLAFAFTQLLSLPMSPAVEAMIAARKRGRLHVETPPAAFGSVDAIMAQVNASADCVAVVDRLGLLPVIYPRCFTDGCQPRP
jgi:hypothetical protein